MINLETLGRIFQWLGCNIKYICTFPIIGRIAKYKQLLISAIMELLVFLLLSFLNISVLTNPGCKEFEVTPVPLSFSANPRAVITLHNFELEYI